MTVKAKLVNMGLRLKDLQVILKNDYRIFASIPEISSSISGKLKYPKNTEILNAVKEIIEKCESVKKR